MGTQTFTNDVGGGDTVFAENLSTDNVAAIAASQRATSGSGVALRVVSANSGAAAMDLTGAGDLANMKNASGTSVFKVGQSGSVTAGGGVAGGVAALTDAATITVDASKGVDFRVTLGGNRTLANPTNPTDGQKIVFQITQDSGAPRTLSYGTAYEFSTGLPQPTLSGAAGRTDLLGFIFNAAKGTWLFVAFVNGFA